MRARLKTGVRILAFLSLILFTNACDTTVERATDWALRNAEQAQKGADDAMSESESIPLPDELSIPLIGEYTVLSVDRSEVGEHTFVSVSVLYRNGDFQDLVEHFDSVFADTESVSRTGNADSDTQNVSWSALDPIRSVAITGVPVDGIVAVGVSEEIAQR